MLRFIPSGRLRQGCRPWHGSLWFPSGPGRLTDIIHETLISDAMVRRRGQGGAGGSTSDGGPQLGSESRSKEEEEAAAKEEQKRRRELQEKLKAMVRATARRRSF